MFNHFEGAVEPQRNEPLYNKVLNITNNFLYPSIIVKYMEKDLNIMKSRYSRQVLPIPLPFVILKFHFSSCLLFTGYFSNTKSTIVVLAACYLPDRSIKNYDFLMEQLFL